VRASTSSLTTPPPKVEPIKERLPTLLASSVIRGAHLGESHGGIYLVDLDRGTVELKLDWDRADIDFGGRGGDRGLRGIAFYGEHILVAANSQLLVLDRSFGVVDAFANRYLRHCHEISVTGDRVFLTATGYDSLLTFDLKTKRFTEGRHLGLLGDSLVLRSYDPSTSVGPEEGHQFHINSVTASASNIWFSGLYTPGLLHTDGRTVALAARLPQGTHNAQIHEGGVLYNDTESGQVCYRRNGARVEMAVPEFAPGEIINLERFASAVARPGFARGLCAWNDGWVAGGSSPSTISVYNLRDSRRVLQRNLSMDVRNAIHGLAIWPYA
jgi:hypothetical protein